MSTRSEIGIQNKSGTIESIYCHRGGYLEHNGLILYLYYNTEEKARELIKNGNLRFLAEKIEPDKNTKHSFEDRQNGVCVYYHRDRGESWENVKPRESENIKDWKAFIQKGWKEYAYLFKGGKWYFFDLDYEDCDLKELTYNVLKTELQTFNCIEELKLLEEFENKKAANMGKHIDSETTPE